MLPLLQEEMVLGEGSLNYPAHEVCTLMRIKLFMLPISSITVLWNGNGAKQTVESSLAATDKGMVHINSTVPTL